jgi:hypothetical protein
MHQSPAALRKFTLHVALPSLFWLSSPKGPAVALAPLFVIPEGNLLLSLLLLLPLLALFYTYTPKNSRHLDRSDGQHHRPSRSGETPAFRFCSCRYLCPRPSPAKPSSPVRIEPKSPATPPDFSALTPVNSGASSPDLSPMFDVLSDFQGGGGYLLESEKTHGATTRSPHSRRRLGHARRGR